MTDRFHFRKSWGAEPLDGGWRFRLWAPSQKALSLKVDGSGIVVPMERGEDGWFEVDTDALRAGDGYAFLLDDGRAVPDPAARAQVGDIDGPSRLVDPTEYRWENAGWKGRPWEETVLYELHTGTFTPEGSFDAVARRLDHLAAVGVTAVELLPVAQFAGLRGWGYDGVHLYAPHVAYGGPDGLKRLVDAAHARGLMVFLDVVYNHFGPEGNFLPLYAPDFFHPEHHTPWGAAIAYEKKSVRAFFIENALFWLQEYRFDGLRLDAIDQIADQSDEPILQELAQAVRAQVTDRPVHLTTEDDRNITRLHERDAKGRAPLYDGEWNDDFHHVAHVVATGEDIGYYADYCDRPAAHLARALATGYVYQGEPSIYRDGKPRGESSAHLPPSAFVNFLQNHDQIGNRAYSERLTRLAPPEMVEALLAVLLLSPQIPLLFMGEEWGETSHFGYFTDFHGELARAVREGRRREFAKWPHFANEEHSARIDDPNAETTFEQSRLDWDKLDDPDHRRRLDFVTRVLSIRHREIVPLVAAIGGNAGSFEMIGERAFSVVWRVGEGTALHMVANFSAEAAGLRAPLRGHIVFSYAGKDAPPPPAAVLAPGAVIVTVEEDTEFVPLPV